MAVVALVMVAQESQSCIWRMALSYLRSQVLALVVLTGTTQQGKAAAAAGCHIVSLGTCLRIAGRM